MDFRINPLNQKTSRIRKLTTLVSVRLKTERRPRMIHAHAADRVQFATHAGIFDH